jgi:hypothetical protein
VITPIREGPSSNVESRRGDDRDEANTTEVSRRIEEAEGRRHPPMRD